jgi:uncharacterized membrane protein
MKDTYRITISRFNIDFEVRLIWLTYFPFIGWLYPFIVMHTDSFVMHHAKQAFVIALFFTAVPVLLTFSSVFITISLRGLKLAFVIMIYFSHLCYFALCALGFMKMKEKTKYEFPVIGKYAKKVAV